MTLFYTYPQSTALTTFLPLLQPHLPYSNPLYNRLKAPHNIPTRHCLFAATFPPSTISPPETYTILFADRSRHSESQIWLFNPLITLSTPLSASQSELLNEHSLAIILFFKTIQIPEAPGWPFSPILRFGCLHERQADSLMSLASQREALARVTSWKLWVTLTQNPATLQHTKSLPPGFSVARVPEDQLEIILSTSTIVRQPSTMLALPNIAILDLEGKVVAWGYVGIDGSFATLFVLAEYRGRGFATYVARELLGRYGRGGFADLGFDGLSGWVHADVKEGNEGSEGVMRAIGGKVLCESRYVWVDSEKF